MAHDDGSSQEVIEPPLKCGGSQRLWWVLTSVVGWALMNTATMDAQVAWPAHGSSSSLLQEPPTANRYRDSGHPCRYLPWMPQSHAANAARQGVPRVPITQTLASAPVVCRAFDV